MRCEVWGVGCRVVISPNPQPPTDRDIPSAVKHTEEPGLDEFEVDQPTRGAIHTLLHVHRLKSCGGGVVMWWVRIRARVRDEMRGGDGAW